MFLVDAKTKASLELRDGAIIGRDPASDFVVDDKSVSRVHAQVEKTDDGFLLRDLGSSRGTYYNGERVETVGLDSGTRFALGSARFEISESLQSETFDPRVAPASKMHFRPAEDVWDPEELQADYERLRVVYELHRALGVQRESEKVLEEVLQTAFRLLSAERGVIQLFETDGRPARSVSYTRSGPVANLQLSQTVLDEAVGEKKGIIIADAQIHDRFSRAESIALEGVRSVMCVPLLYEDSVLGVFQVDSLHASHAFESKDLMLFSAIASHAAVIIHDIIAREEAASAQEARVARERLALVGQVAGGIAKEFDRLLQSISMGIRRVRSHINDGDLQVEMATVAEAADRAADLLSELLPFGQAGAPSDNDRAFDTQLEAILDRMATDLPQGVRLTRELGAGSGCVTLPTEHIEGVVVNLVRNSKDAVGPRGEVLVRTWRERVEVESGVKGLAPGAYAVLEVVDNGPGVPDEVLDRLFEPFVSTKEGGTGLGLASVSGIVQQAGGKVEHRPTKGEGTTFVVYLPLVAARGARSSDVVANQA